MSKNLIEKVKRFFDERFGRTQAYVEIYNALEELRDFLTPRIFFLKVLVDKYELSKMDEGLSEKLFEALITTAPNALFNAYLQILEEIVLNESLRFDEKIKHINAATATFKHLFETIHLSDLYNATVKFFPDVFTQSQHKIQEEDRSSLLPIICFYTQFKFIPPPPDPYTTYITANRNHIAKIRCVDDYQKEILSRMEQFDSAENLVFFLSMMNSDFLPCNEPIKFATQKLLFDYIQQKKPTIEAFLGHDILISLLYGYIDVFCQMAKIKDIDSTKRYPANEQTRFIEMLNLKLKERLGIDCDAHDSEQAPQASSSSNTQNKKRRRRRKKKKTAQAAASSMTVAGELLDKPHEVRASTSGVSEASPSLDVAFKIHELRRPPNPYNFEEIRALLECFRQQFFGQLSSPRFEGLIPYLESLVFEENISIETHMMIELLRFIQYATNADVEEEKWPILASIELLQDLVNIIFAVHDINETLLSLKNGQGVLSEEAHALKNAGETLQFLFQCADKFDVKRERLIHAPSEHAAPQITPEMHRLIDRAMKSLFDKLLYDGLFDFRIKKTKGHKLRVINEINLVELLNSGINLFELIAQTLPIEAHDRFLFNFMLVVLMGLQDEDNESLYDLFSMTLVTRFEELTSARRHENPLLDQMALTLMLTREQKLDGNLFLEHVRMPFMERMANAHSELSIFEATINIMGKILAYTKLDKSAALTTLSRNVDSSLLYSQHTNPEKPVGYKGNLALNLFFIDLPPANALNTNISAHSNYEEAIACYFIFSLLLDPEQREIEHIVKAYQADFSLKGIEFTYEQQDFTEPRRYLRNLGFLWALMHFDPVAKAFYSQTIFYYLKRIEQNAPLDRNSNLSAQSIDPADKPRGVGCEVNCQQTLAEIFLNLRLEISGNFEALPVYPNGVWGEYFSGVHLHLRQSFPDYALRMVDKEKEPLSKLEEFLISIHTGTAINLSFYKQATEELPWRSLFFRSEAWIKLYLKIIIPLSYLPHERVTILSSYLTIDDFDDMTIDEDELINMDSIDAALLLLFLFIGQKAGTDLSCFPIFERFITTATPPDRPFEERTYLDKLLLDAQNTGPGPKRKLTLQTAISFEHYDQQIALAFLKFSMTSIKEGHFYELETVPFIEVLHAVAVFSSSQYYGLDIDTFIFLLNACPNRDYVGIFLDEVFDENSDKNSEIAAYNPLRNKISFYCEEVGDWTQPLINLHEKLKQFDLSRKRKRQLNTIFNPVAEHQERFVEKAKSGIAIRINELEESQTSVFELYFKEIKNQYHIPENMDHKFREFTEKLFQANRNIIYRKKVNALKEGMKPGWVLKHTENPDDAILMAMQEESIPEKYFKEILARFQKILKETQPQIAQQDKSVPETSEQPEKPSSPTIHASSEVSKRDFAGRIRALDLSALADSNGFGKPQSIFKHNPREFSELGAACRNKVLEFMQLHAAERFVFIKKYAGNDINATAKRTLETFLDNWAAFGQACEQAQDFLEQIHTLIDMPEAGNYLALGLAPLGKEIFKFCEKPYQLSAYECDSEDSLTLLINTSENLQALQRLIWVLHHKMNHPNAPFEPHELDGLLQKFCSKIFRLINSNTITLSKAHGALVDLNRFFEHDVVIAARALFECLNDIGCFFDADRQRLLDIRSGADFEIGCLSLEQCFFLQDTLKHVQEAAAWDIYDLEALKNLIIERYTKEAPIKLFCLIHEAYEQKNFILTEGLHQALWKKFDIYLYEILKKQMDPDIKKDPQCYETVYGFITKAAIDHNLLTIQSQLQRLYQLIPDAWLFGGMVFNFFSERDIKTLEKEHFDLDLIAPSFETAEELIEYFENDRALKSRLSKLPFCPCKKELPHLVRLKFITGFEVDIHVGDPAEKLKNAKGYCPLTALQMARQFTPDALPFAGVEYQTYLDDLAVKQARFPNLQEKLACIEEPGEIAILLALMMKTEYKKGCVIDAEFKQTFAKQVDLVFEGLFQPNERSFYLVKSKLQEIKQYQSQEDATYQVCREKLEIFVSDYTTTSRASREMYGHFSHERCIPPNGASQSGVNRFDGLSLPEQIQCASTITDIIHILTTIDNMHDKPGIITESVLFAFNAKAMEVLHHIDALSHDEVQQISPIFEKISYSDHCSMHIKPLLEKLDQLLTDFHLLRVKTV